MSIRETYPEDDLLNGVRRPAALLSAAVLVTATVMGTIMSPFILDTVIGTNDNYSKLGNIGQAYGVASAILAAMALVAVGASLCIQHRQLRFERERSGYQLNDELVRIAMEDPAYCQCWGGRVSPAGVDERLFYYCGQVIKCWKRAWERRDMTEREARSFLKQFFDSEVPRLFWERHGD